MMLSPLVIEAMITYSLSNSYRNRLEIAVKATGGRISLSFDYVIAAEHSSTTTLGSITGSNEDMFRDVPDMTVDEVANGVNHASIAAALNVVEQESEFTKLHQRSVQNDIHSSDESVDASVSNT